MVRERGWKREAERSGGSRGIKRDRGSDGER